MTASVLSLTSGNAEHGAHNPKSKNSSFPVFDFLDLELCSKPTTATVEVRSHRIQVANIPRISLAVVWPYAASTETKSSGGKPARNRTFVYVISFSIEIA